MDVTKTHLFKEHKHTSPLISCRFSPDGKTVYFGAEDFSVWSWNIDTDTKVKFDTEAWCRSLAITMDGKTLFTGSYDGRLMWWSTESAEPKPIRAIDAHTGWLRAVDISPDDTHIASVGDDRIVRLWNIADGKLIQELKPLDDAAVAANAVAEAAAAPKEDPAAKEDKAKKPAPKRLTLRHESFIYNVAFHPNGTTLVTGDLMGKVIDWDLESGTPVRAFEAKSLSKYDTGFRAQIGGFRTLQFNHDATKLYGSGITNVSNAFAGVGNPSVVEFDWKAGTQLLEYLSKPKLQGVAWGAAIHSNGTIIGAHGGSGGSLMFWEPAKTEPVHQLKLKQNARDLDLHEASESLAVACTDNHIRVYRMSPKTA